MGRIIAREDLGDYLDRNHLVNLKSYQYRSVDKSFIANHVLKHWWNKIASFMPQWLAPNAITLLGFLAILINIATVLVYIPDLEGPVPRWIYFSFALGYFFYQTMDNVDGKQARKTGTSSPLGELFDHGIDTLNCPLGAIIMCSALGLGHSHFSIWLILLSCCPMYLSTWEEFHTGVLYLGFINGPCEGILIAIVTFLWTTLQGPEFWHLQAYEVFGKNRWISEEIQMIDLYLLMVGFALVGVHAPGCVWNVFNCLSQSTSISTPTTAPSIIIRQTAPLKLDDDDNDRELSTTSSKGLAASFIAPIPGVGVAAASARRPTIAVEEGTITPTTTFPPSGSSSSSVVPSPSSNNPTTTTTLTTPTSIQTPIPLTTKLHVFLQSLYQLAPMFLFLGLASSWSLDDESVILKNERVIEFGLILTFIFGRLNSRIILAQLTKGEFPYGLKVLLPLAIGCTIVKGPRVFGITSSESSLIPILETLYLHSLLPYVFVTYVSEALQVIESICDYLGIGCLTIKRARLAPTVPSS